MSAGTSRSTGMDSVGQTIKRIGFSALSVLVLACGTTACGAASEPDALADDQQQAIVDLVQDHGTDFTAPSCQVEVFRIGDPATFGWATCTETQGPGPAPATQAASFPFKITGDTVQKPEDGDRYLKDVQEMFPEDLWSALEQRHRGA